MPTDDAINDGSPNDRSDEERSDAALRNLARQIVQPREEELQVTPQELSGLGSPITNIINDNAEHYASRHGWDSSRVAAVLERTAHLPAGPAARQLEFVQKFGLMFRPRMDDVLACFLPDDALALLESDELPEIQHRLISIEYLNLPGIPFYTLEELQTLTSSFISHLEAETNKAHLIKTGHPARSFERSPWLESWLGKLYHTKLPAEIEKRELSVSEGGSRPVRPIPEYMPRVYGYEYKWARKADLARITSRSEEMPYCTYPEADLLFGMDPADAARLSGMRHKFLDLKVQVLHILVKALQTRKKETAAECLRLLTNHPAAQVEFWLRMDQFYRAYSTHRDNRQVADVGAGDPGGLSSLLEIIWHFLEELTIGPFWRTREALADMVELDCIGRPQLSQTKYLRAIGTSEQQVIDDALDLLGELQEEGLKAREDYYHGVKQALEQQYRKETEFGYQMAYIRETMQVFTSSVARVADITFPELPTDVDIEPFPEKVLVIQDEGRLVMYLDQEVELTSLERRLLLALARSPGKWIPYGDLGRAGWGKDGLVDFGTLRTHIKNIRAKLAEAGKQAGVAEPISPRDLISNQPGNDIKVGSYRLDLEKFQIQLPDSRNR